MQNYDIFFNIMKCNYCIKTSVPMAVSVQSHRTDSYAHPKKLSQYLFDPSKDMSL